MISLETGAGENGVDPAWGGTAREIPRTIGINKIKAKKYFSTFSLPIMVCTEMRPGRPRNSVDYTPV